MRPFEREKCNTIQDKLTLLNKLDRIEEVFNGTKFFTIVIGTDINAVTLTKDDYSLLETNFRASITSLQCKLLKEIEPKE